MVKVTFIASDGGRRDVEVKEGLSARDAALFNNVRGIDGDCGGVCACATCHVYVDEAWIARVGPLEEGSMESDLIQFAEETRPASRLACQIAMTKELDGLVLHIPALQH
jgi:ferredoxin, 2Fe-2S